MIPFTLIYSQQTAYLNSARYLTAYISKAFASDFPELVTNVHDLTQFLSNSE